MELKAEIQVFRTFASFTPSRKVNLQIQTIEKVEDL